jgi:serine kinase of HPr protein (carbohydrate metabolism regulator)
MSEVKNLSQDNSTMFERNVAIKASKEEEVQVTTPGDNFIGFICGLDDNWIQICGKNEDDYSKGKDWELILLNRNKVISIHSTGATSNDLDASIKEYVQRKIHTFSTVSKTFLEKKK